MRNTQVILARRPDGEVTPDCFALRETEVPDLADGDVLVRNIYLSCDPYMRGQMGTVGNARGAFALDEPIPARVVGQVAASRNPRFAEGAFVWSFLNWEHYTLVRAGAGLRTFDPVLGPVSHAISVLGMNGLTAEVGLIEIGRPRPGETVFVSAASGAVGQIAGQLARIAGARVVGSAGSDEKIGHITGTLRFDAAFNYKTADSPGAALDEHCPDGIDVYFDNVGGAMLDAVLARLNHGARLPICGQISQYDAFGTERTTPLYNLVNLLKTRSVMTGFSVREHMDKFDAFVPRMAALLKSGDVVYTEDIVDGIENAPAAFIGMMKGENLGKRLVRVGDDPML